MQKYCAAWLTLVFMVPGCGNPHPPIGGGGGADPGPGCVSASPPFTPRAAWACEQPEPCNGFHIAQDGRIYEQSMHGPEGGATIEDARCVLQGLRDGTPGRYSFVLDTPSMPGFLVDFHSVNVLPNGNAVESVNPFRDLSPTSVSHAYVTRKPAAFFDGCLALPPGPELFACFRTWSAGAASGCAVCPAP